MKSYKFKDYVLFKEVFELPNHHDSNISSILEKLNPHDIVEFALHVVEDVLKFAEDRYEKEDIEAVIRGIRNWLQHPTAETAEMVRDLTTVAPDEEMNQALNSANDAGTAVYYAQYNDAEFAAREAAYAANSAAMAAYHATNGELQDRNKVYDKTINKYKSWANAYHVTPTAPHANKSEIAKLMDEEGSHLPYLLDYLEENGMKPSDFTLKQFGVKRFGNNKEIAQQIIENGMLSGFYRAISNSLSKTI